MMDGRPNTMDHSRCFHKCISWSSVIGGGLVGLGLSFLLNAFSVAIGLAAFSTNQEGVTAFAVGGFIGFAISVIASMFVAGFVSGSLAKPYCTRPHLGAMYGFLTWVLTLILVVLLSGHLARFVSSYSDALSNRPVVVTMGNEQAPSLTVSQSNASVTIVNAQSAASDLSKVAFAAFVLFFLGAASSCFGGYAGMSCRKEECDSNRLKV